MLRHASCDALVNESFTRKEPSMTDRSRLMTGMFPDRESCEGAYGCITGRGYTKDDVTLLMSDDARRRYFPPSGEKTELGTKAAEGAGVGAVVGGGVGA